MRGMRNHAPIDVLVGVLVALLVPAAGLSAQESKSAAVEASLTALEHSLYFVLPAKQVPAGKKAGLVVVLPGGDGSREFLPWVENGLLAQRPDDCVGVLVTAVKWQPDQQVVWPTAKSKVPDMKYTTEDYVRAVVDEVGKTRAIDPARSIVVAWSSSGPAVYPMLVAKDSPFIGGYVAMSIWPKDLGDLAAVKGRRFFLDQSPDDQVTTFDHVRGAFAALTKAKAVLRLSTYQGGHGWNDDPLPRIREGLRWLLSDEPAPKPVWPEGKAKKASSGKSGANLVANPGFEQGLEGWNAIDNSKHIEIAIAKDEHSAGKQSLHLKKTGAMPLDLVTQEIELPEGSTVTASVKYKSKAATNAWIKVWLYGDGDEAQDKQALNKDADLARAVADGDWQKVEKSWDCKGAKRAVVQFVMVMGGELWLDEVVLQVGK
jgi:hypothetical protein